MNYAMKTHGNFIRCHTEMENNVRMSLCCCTRQWRKCRPWVAKGGTDAQKEHAATALRNLAGNKTNLAAMKDLGYGKESFFGGWTVP